MELSVFSIVILVISGILLALAVCGGVLKVLAARNRRCNQRLLEANSIAHRSAHADYPDKYQVKYFTTPTYSIAREWEEGKWDDEREAIL